MNELVHTNTHIRASPVWPSFVNADIDHSYAYILLCCLFRIDLRTRSYYYNSKLKRFRELIIYITYTHAHKHFGVAVVVVLFAFDSFYMATPWLALWLKTLLKMVSSSSCSSLLLLIEWNTQKKKNKVSSSCTARVEPQTIHFCVWRYPPPHANNSTSWENV